MTDQAEGRPTMPQASLVFSTKEFCEEARISVRHLYSLLAKGEGPRVIRLGRRVLIARDTATRWLMDRETAVATSKARAIEPQPSARELAKSEVMGRPASRSTIITGRGVQPRPALAGALGPRRPW